MTSGDGATGIPLWLAWVAVAVAVAAAPLAALTWTSDPLGFALGILWLAYAVVTFNVLLRARRRRRPTASGPPR